MKKILILASLLFWSQATTASDPIKLHFGYAKGFIQEDMFLEILSLAYKQHSIEIGSVPAIGVRSMRLADEGKLDGEMVRTRYVAQQYVNLILVPVPIFQADIYAYATKPIKNITTWSDLHGKRIGYRIGILLYDANTEEKNRVKFHAHKDVISALHRGGIEIAVMGRQSYLQFKRTDIYRSAVPLHSTPLYHFLHKSHKQLLPAITATLKAMHDSGKIASIIKKHEEKWLSQPKSKN